LRELFSYLVLDRGCSLVFELAHPGYFIQHDLQTENSMDIATNNGLPFFIPAYTQLLTSYDPEHAALWYYMNPKPRPCFTSTLLREIRDLQQRVRDYVRSTDDASSQLHYFIKASALPGVYNLGGDLKLFVQLIAERNRDALYDYGRLCIDVVYDNATNLSLPTLTTISLVQGSALGGGLEAALAQNVLVAEESAQLGFPEILFNLFPGMGAYSLLARRIEAVRAERLLRSGQQHSGKELWEMGVVDVVARDGEGVHAVNTYIRSHSHARNGHQAIQQVRQRINPLTYQELLDVVEIWVDAALRLTTRDLRMMTKLVAAQQRLEVSEQGAAFELEPSAIEFRALPATNLEGARRIAGVNG
jgi:DSF synthase